VRNVRGARGEHRRWPSAEAWREYLEALSAKGMAIRKAKAAHFKQAVADAARGRRGIWPLAKWAKEQSHLLPTPPTIPNLVIPSGIVTTPLEKAEALKSRIFPPMPNADLTDIPNASYPAEMPSPMSVFEKEISSVIKMLHPFKAAGSHGIPSFVFRCLSSQLVSNLQPLFQACINLSYHPIVFCHCNTISLKKPGKRDYSAP
jgi:hypothetical protein